MTKSVSILSALISSVAGVASAQDIIQTLNVAGVREMGQDGKFELSVDQLYGVTQVIQKAGLELSVLGTSSNLGKINVQIGKGNTVAVDGTKTFTPKTVQELSMFGDVVVN